MKEEINWESIENTVATRALSQNGLYLVRGYTIYKGRENTETRLCIYDKALGFCTVSSLGEDNGMNDIVIESFAEIRRH